MNAPTARREPGSPAIDAASSILTLGIDSASVRTCLLEMVSGRCRLAAWSSTPLQPGLSIDAQAGGLLQHLGDRLHRTLWHGSEGAPFMLSDDPASYPPLGQVTVVASPRSHVRVWLAGLTATQSLGAAEEALGGGPAQIVGQTLHSADLQVGRLAAVLARVEIDLVVLVGGYDYPDSEALAAAVRVEPCLCRRTGAHTATAAAAGAVRRQPVGRRRRGRDLPSCRRRRDRSRRERAPCSRRAARGQPGAGGEFRLLAALPPQRGYARDQPLGNGARPYQQHRKQFRPACSGVAGAQWPARSACSLLWPCVVAACSGAAGPARVGSALRCAQFASRPTSTAGLCCAWSAATGPATCGRGRPAPGATAADLLPRLPLWARLRRKPCYRCCAPTSWSRAASYLSEAIASFIGCANRKPANGILPEISLILN